MKTNTRGYEHQRLLFSALRNDRPANAESKVDFCSNYSGEDENALRQNEHTM